jgi:hypothetical protein
MDAYRKLKKIILKHSPGSGVGQVNPDFSYTR